MVSPKFQERLEDVRGGAPRRGPTVRALAAFAGHTDCPLAAVAFAAGVDLDRLLKGTRLQPSFGQSPFAFARGLAFENRLREQDYASLRHLLPKELNFPATGGRVENLRTGYPHNRDGMRERAEVTRELLRRIVRGSADAPQLIDGAVYEATVGGLSAHFEADALAASLGGTLRVLEVKSFPKVDERVDADQLGAALDQVAVYLLLTRSEVLRLGGDPERLVSDLAFLITPRNVGMQPTLSVKVVGSRVARVEKLLGCVPRAVDVAAAVPPGLSFGPIADTGAEEDQRVDALGSLADRLGTAYRPSCLSDCGNARFCRERAVCSGSPHLLGSAPARLMPGVVGLGRAGELTRGASPTAGEGPAAAILAQAGRLYDEITLEAGNP